MIAFTAKGVAATTLEDLNSHVVVLAEDPDGDGGPRLEISRALTHSEQDRRLGQDTYCLSTQTGATHYGGVLSYGLKDSMLTMRLDSTAKDALGVEAEFSIFLDADSSTVEDVRQALASILTEVGERDRKGQ
jgi:hypothetical protein